VRKTSLNGLWLRIGREAHGEGPSKRSVQLTLCSSVSSTSVTVITPKAGCSITSTATVLTAGAVGCFIRFFAGARLGLALAKVSFAAAFPRAALAPFFFWTSDDYFLRLAIVGPLFWLALRKRIDANLYHLRCCWK
jgi:hypothetical protein